MLKKIKQDFGARFQDKSLLELIKGSANTLLLRVLGFVVGYIFIFIISRFYGSSVVGSFTLCSTVLIIFSVIGRLGFDSSIVRFFAQNVTINKWDVVYEIYKKILTLIIPWTILLSLFLFFSSAFIADSLFHKPTLKPYLQIISFGVLPITLRFINSESYRGFKMMWQYAYTQNVSYLLYASVILGSISVFYKNDFLPIICFVFSLCFLALTSSYFVLKKIKRYTKTVSDSIAMWKMIRISSPMMLSTSLLLISGWINTIMLGIYGTESEVGMYNVIFKIGTFSSIVLTSVNSIAAPKFAELHILNDHTGLNNTAIQTSKINFWVSLPIFVITIFFRQSILGLFGKEFEAGADVLMFTMVGQFINIFSGSVGTFLNMTGHQNAQRVVILIATLINVFCCFVFIPSYGLMGSAICGMIFMASWNIMALLYIKIRLNIQTYYNPFNNHKS